jgi:hypothetical protein
MNDKERDILATHLPHELTMLHYCLDQVNRSSGDPLSNERDPRRIIAFECFWLHARNLIEFFETNATDANVVSPRAFTKDALVYSVGSDTLMRRINEQISHLQRERGLSTDAPLTGLDMIEVKDRIDSAVSRFQTNLREEAKEWWTFRTPMSMVYHQALAATACTEITMFTSTPLQIRS